MAAAFVRTHLIERLESARRVSDDLLTIVRPNALYERPIAERHRIVFYLGHLEAFDWNLLISTLVDVPSFNPDLDKLFAFGIDPVGGGLPADVPSDWPALNHVRSYCHRLRETLDREITRIPDSPQRDQILNVAIEHRLMHAETLAYMFHWLPVEQKLQQNQPATPQPAPVVPCTIEVPAGTATLGLRRHREFGWDNEFMEHTVEVPAFAIDKYKITNAQFLDFVRAGGYAERSLWTDEDWHWRENAAIRHPKFWFERDGEWWLRTMFDEIPLPYDWPVYVSHAEAAAYTRWKNRKLPTETQWHRAAYGTFDGVEREFPWGSQAPSLLHGNFNFRRWNPTPVTAHAAGTSAFGISDLLGNGWEWTATPFAPFEGFEPFPFYPGYSANFFDGKHYVMKGGSARTASCMLRRSFRNWFQAHYPHIYSGFRCVSS